MHLVLPMSQIIIHCTDVPLKVRQHPTSGVFVDGLIQTPLNGLQHTLDVMRQGDAARHVAATKMNSGSSRSHSIFTLNFTSVEMLGREESSMLCTNTNVRTSKLNLVDLAGSEVTSKSGVEGINFTEAKNINLSLTTLGRVIDALSQLSKPDVDKKITVPYRDSTLTFILSDSLGGNSKTTMIATVSPHVGNIEETVSTLRYASRAREIVNVVIKNEDPSIRKIRELTEEVENLKKQMTKKGSANNLTKIETKSELINLQSENDSLKEMYAKMMSLLEVDNKAPPLNSGLCTPKGKAGDKRPPASPSTVTTPAKKRDGLTLIKDLKKELVTLQKEKSRMDKESRVTKTSKGDKVEEKKVVKKLKDKDKDKDKEDKKDSKTAGLLEQLQERTQQLNDATEEVKELTTSLEKAEEENDALVDSSSALELALSDKNAVLENKDCEIDEQNTEILSLQTRQHTTLKELEEVKIAHDLAEGALQTSAKQLAEKERHVSEVLGQVESAKEQTAKAVQEGKDLRDQLASVTSKGAEEVTALKRKLDVAEGNHAEAAHSLEEANKIVKKSIITETENKSRVRGLEMELSAKAAELTSSRAAAKTEVATIRSVLDTFKKEKTDIELKHALSTKTLEDKIAELEAKLIEKDAAHKKEVSSLRAIVDSFKKESKDAKCSIVSNSVKLEKLNAELSEAARKLTEEEQKTAAVEAQLKDTKKGLLTLKTSGAEESRLAQKALVAMRAEYTEYKQQSVQELESAKTMCAESEASRTKADSQHKEATAALVASHEAVLEEKERALVAMVAKQDAAVVASASALTAAVDAAKECSAAEVGRLVEEHASAVQLVQKECDTLQTELVNKTEALNVALAEAEHHKAHIAVTERSHADASETERTHLAAAEENVAQLTLQTTSQAETIEVLRADLECSKTSEKDTQNRVDELEGRVSALLSDNVVHTAATAQLEEALQVSKDEKVLLMEQEAAQKETMSATVQAQVQATRDECAAVHAKQLAEVTASLAEAKAEATQQAVRVTSQAGEQMQKQINEHAACLKELTLSHEEEVAKIQKQASQDITIIREEVSKLQDDNSTLVSQASALESCVADLQKQNDVHAAELDRRERAQQEETESLKQTSDTHLSKVNELEGALERLRGQHAVEAQRSADLHKNEKTALLQAQASSLTTCKSKLESAEAELSELHVEYKSLHESYQAIERERDSYVAMEQSRSRSSSADGASVATNGDNKSLSNSCYADTCTSFVTAASTQRSQLIPLIGAALFTVASCLRSKAFRKWVLFSKEVQHRRKMQVQRTKLLRVQESQIMSPFKQKPVAPSFVSPHKSSATSTSRGAVMRKYSRVRKDLKWQVRKSQAQETQRQMLLQYVAGYADVHIDVTATNAKLEKENLRLKKQLFQASEQIDSAEERLALRDDFAALDTLAVPVPTSGLTPAELSAQADTLRSLLERRFIQFKESAVQDMNMTRQAHNCLYLQFEQREYDNVMVKLEKALASCLRRHEGILMQLNVVLDVKGTFQNMCADVEHTPQREAALESLITFFRFARNLEDIEAPMPGLLGRALAKKSFPDISLALSTPRGESRGRCNTPRAAPPPFGLATPAPAGTPRGRSSTPGNWRILTQSLATMEKEEDRSPTAGLGDARNLARGIARHSAPGAERSGSGGSESSSPRARDSSNTMAGPGLPPLPRAVPRTPLVGFVSQSPVREDFLASQESETSSYETDDDNMTVSMTADAGGKKKDCVIM